MEKTTNKNLTEVVFILDRSGSMGGLEADTIGGYNSMLKKQQEEDGDVVISTVLFDDQMEVIHDRRALGDVKPITDKEYYVRGCTALLDAVGGAIHHIGHVQKALPDDYTYDKVKKMVEKKKEKKGWEFIFMGANIDAIAVADRFGVAANRAVRYECDKVGTALNFGAMSNIITHARHAASCAEVSMALDTEEDKIFEDIRGHYAEANS